MKKTLIASAVAAAALSTNTFAMDQGADIAEMLESMPEIYGTIELVNQTIDVDGESDSTFDDNGSTLGIKHDSKITEDVTAFLKAEFEFGADDKETSGGIDTLDEAYIGIKGGFGSIQVGSDDTVYEWIDHVDIEEANGELSSDVAGMAEGDNLQYVSPEIADGLEVGITLPLDLAADDEFNMAIAANYSMDNIDLSLAYANGRDDFESAIGFAGTVGLDDLAVTLQYETQSDDSDFLGLLGVYTMGANQFALGYSIREADGDAGDEERSDIFVQALHNASDNMYVYIEYTDSSFDEDDSMDQENLSVGAVYAF